MLYRKLVGVRNATNPSPSPLYVDSTPLAVKSNTLTHRLIAPPAAPHVSGRVIQASVWIPRSTHCPFVLFVLTAQFIFKIKTECT